MAVIAQTSGRTAGILAQSRMASKDWCRAVLPGVLLTAAIAALALIVRQGTGLLALSPMILAILIGICLKNTVGVPVMAKAGTVFCMRRVLRFAIVLLGLQLTVTQVSKVGFSGVAMIASTVISTFVFTIWLGKQIGVERKLAELIAAGTSICGASAVMATNTVTGASDEDVAYAIACVTIFGSIAMISYPVLAPLLHLDARAFGLWTGASIHEIAQVVAASFQNGAQAGEFGTVSKLTRVMMLAPMIIAIGAAATHRARATGEARSEGKAPMPWFVLGFIALVFVNSAVAIPVEVKATAVTATTFLLSMALAAMGLETDIGRLRARGLRPLLLGLAAFVFIAGFSLVWVKARS